ncbi:MAG: hypothetical protein RLZZ301_1500 [Bacteroidota bacterium]|jgi:hypothetical protein
MYRKLLTIIFVAGGLGLVLFVKSFLFEKPTPPRLVDRLPSADFLGKANILELAKETSAMLQYNKLSMRDFTTYEFLLGQGKQYGIDLQENLYLFANENGNWGVLLKLTDSSKVSAAIERLRNYATITDSSIDNNRFFYIQKEQSYLHYGKDYVLIYQGNQFLKTLNQVLSAHYRGIDPAWKRFLKQPHFRDEHLVIYANWPKLKQFDIETAMFAHDSDSLSFKLKSYIKKKTPLYFAQKQNQKALGYHANGASGKMIDIHLDIDEFRQQKQDSVYVQLAKLGRKFGFPFEAFIRAWNGDLAYQEGGTQVIPVRYIETVLDEDFNETEVERLRYDTVPAFSVLLSLNQFGPQFIGKLAKKGLLRQDGDAYRFLFSPPLKFSKVGPTYQYYSGAIAPRLQYSTANHVLWKYQGTNYYFRIDKLTRYEIFGSLQIPVRHLLRKNKLI